MAAKKTGERHRPYPGPSVGKEAVQIVPVTQTHKVELRAARIKKKDEARQETLRSLEDELLETSMETIRHSLDFATIPFDADDKENTGALDELVELYGKEKGERVFRTIKAAQMPTKDAPAGLLIAQKVASSIIKARSAEKVKPNPLNIAIQVVQSAPQFEEMDLDE